MGTFKGGGRGSPRGGGGIRPVFDMGGFAREKPDYKTLALCKQVRRAVSLVLAGECADEMLQSLLVDEVLPAPNAGRLLVRVYARVAGHEGVIDVLQRLERVHGLLRMRVAESIARKRAPELAFEVIPSGVISPGGDHG